jgi:uncharacterized protein YndB with AHSA1/START domain
MNKKRNNTTLEKPHPKVVLTRLFDAPRELLWKCWTEPGRLRQWWGPKGFTNPVCEVALRPGGFLNIDMKAPDGTVYPMKGVFQVVFPPDRLVFTSSALDKNGQPLFEVLTTAVFTDHGDKTLLTLETMVRHSTPEAAPHIAGMGEGWRQSLERLTDYVTKA